MSVFHTEEGADVSSSLLGRGRRRKKRRRRRREEKGKRR